MEVTHSSGMPPNGKWARDKDYYFDDGSCIFLVENVLFNVRLSHPIVSISARAND